MSYTKQCFVHFICVDVAIHENFNDKYVLSKYGIIPGTCFGVSMHDSGSIKTTKISLR